MGGFSIVWEGTRDEDGAPSAIKVGRHDSPTVIERFRRDAEALSRIGPPHAPRLYQSGELEDGYPYIAMELLGSKTLAARLEEMPAPPEPEWVVRVGSAVLSALMAAHASGIIHRDLKPENIFLDEPGRLAMLIDFGLTRSLEASDSVGITRAGTVVGTPEYMAPEQIRGDPVIDGRVDIYAFGVILYELCTLRLPFVGERASIEHGHLALRPPRPREFAAVPEPLEEMVLACLAKEPARRPADPSALRRALLETCAPAPSSGPSARPTSMPPPGSRPSSSRVRLLTEGRRPMVVLAVETHAVALQVIAAVTRRNGFVARQRGSSFVCVFSGAEIDDPVQAGIAVAREMVGRFEARAALHLASLAIRRQDNAPPAVYGVPVERPETWLPQGPWSGVVLTAEIARVVPENDLGPVSDSAAFYSLAPAAVETSAVSISGIQSKSYMPGSEPPSASSWSRFPGRYPSTPPSPGPVSQPPRSSKPWSPPPSSPSSSGLPSQPPRSRSHFSPMTQRSPSVPADGPFSDDLSSGPPSSRSPLSSRSPASGPLTQPSQSRTRAPLVRSPPPSERQPQPSSRAPATSSAPGSLNAPSSPQVPESLSGDLPRAPGDGAAPPMSQPPRSRKDAGPVSITHRFPLFGREDVLALIEASAEASFNGACPGLFTLIGDHGLGKTRLAHESLAVVERLRPGLTVILLRAAQPLADAAGQTTRELLGCVLGAQEGPPAADAQAFCRGRLGEQLGDEVWAAVAVALGWMTAEAAGVSPVAFQRGTMLALTEGLRRLARSGPVALVLDDAHWADDTALDALEYATLNAEGCPLWVLVTANPRFENVRRTWGSRSQRHDRVTLEPLEEEAGMLLAAELLLPAEYPPAATLKRLAEWAGGNPACLTELARTLKRAGIVRQRPGLGTWYVATAELDRLPPSTAWQWLAVRQLDTLQPELSACVRLCSVLGVEFSRAEVERIQDAMERAGIAGTTIDIGVGLSSLVERRILIRGSGDRYSFQSATFQDAVYKLLDAAHREKIHRHAFELWKSEVGEGEAKPQEPARIERLARHAGACGAREEAAEAYLKLGDAAREKHRHVEADQRYTSALMFIGEGDARRRALALGGRGKVRYRLHRIREALDDLRAARELAGKLSDQVLSADLLLDEATALDHASDFAESARRVDDARPLVEQLGDPQLELRFLCALGRSYVRHGKTMEAVALLSRSADRAKESGDYETRVIALLVLSPILVAAGRLDEADGRFREVLELCTEAEDRLHLGAAYANRAHLWIARKVLDRSMDDLRRAIQLAREVGNPGSECTATNNVAEFLHWLGEEEEALVLARRVRVLEERFIERPVIDGSLLLARIQASRGEYDEVGRLVNWISAHCHPEEAEPVMQAFYSMLRLVLSHVRGARGEACGEVEGWEQVVEKAGSGLFTEELLEALYWRARIALGEERWDEAAAVLEQVSERLEECSMWRLRFADLMSRLILRMPGLVSVETQPAD